MDEVVPSTVLPHVYTYLVKYGYKKTARRLKKEAEASSLSEILSGPGLVEVYDQFRKRALLQKRTSNTVTVKLEKPPPQKKARLQAEGKQKASITVKSKVDSSSSDSSSSDEEVVVQQPKTGKPKSSSEAGLTPVAKPSQVKPNLQQKNESSSDSESESESESEAAAPPAQKQVKVASKEQKILKNTHATSSSDSASSQSEDDTSKKTVPPAAKQRSSSSSSSSESSEDEMEVCSAIANKSSAPPPPKTSAAKVATATKVTKPETAAKHKREPSSSSSEESSSEADSNPVQSKAAKGVGTKKESAKVQSSESESSSSEMDLEASIPRQHSTPMKSSQLSQKPPVNKKPQPDTASSDSSSSEEESEPKSSTKKIEKTLQVQPTKNARTASSSSDSSSSEESAKDVKAIGKSQVATATAAKASAHQASSTSSSDSSSEDDSEEGKGLKVTTPKQATQTKQGIQETKLKEKKTVKKKDEVSSVGGASSNKPGVKLNSATPAKMADTAASGKSPLKPSSNGVKAKGAPVDSSDSSDSDSDAESARTPSALSTPLSSLVTPKSKTPSTVPQARSKKLLSKKSCLPNTPFKRVKDDEVIVDPRVADNSFHAKRGSAGSWGEKAHEVFQHTKGKSFRHEKTKKKRGTYRGGAIDTNVNSVKFDSD